MAERSEIFSNQEAGDQRLLGFVEEELKLPFEIVDPDDVMETFNKYKLVPYSGDLHASGDGLLNFYNQMAADGSTSNACIESKKIVGFGNKAKVVKRTDPSFDLGEEDEAVDKSISQKYVDFVNNINWGQNTQFMDCAINNYFNWEANGNICLELQMFETGKERSVRILTHKQEHLKYKFTAKGEPMVVLYSLKWTSDYLLKNEPIEIPVYPKATKINGVIRTIVHVKNGQYWYGRPPSKGSILHQYNEYQNMLYLCRLTGKDFSGRIIIEVEDDAPQTNRFINQKRDKAEGFKGTLDRFERKFTKGARNPSTIVLTSRPNGAKPMEVSQILPNTNERYYEKMDGILSGHIIKSHAWSPRLLGGNTSSYFSTNVYIDELKVKDATNNLYNQNMVHRAMSTCIREAMIWMGADDLLDYTFQFQSPYLKLIQNEKRVNDLYGTDPDAASVGVGEQGAAPNAGQ